MLYHFRSDLTASVSGHLGRSVTVLTDESPFSPFMSLLSCLMSDISDDCSSNVSFLHFCFPYRWHRKCSRLWHSMNTVWILYCWFPLGSRDLCTCTLCTVLLSKISSCWPWMTLTLILKINRTFVRHLSQYVYQFVGERQRGGLSRTTAGGHRLIGNTDSTSVLPSANIA